MHRALQAHTPPFFSFPGVDLQENGPHLRVAGSSAPIERRAQAGRLFIPGAGVLRALGGQGVLALQLALPGLAAEEVGRQAQQLHREWARKFSGYIT